MTTATKILYYCGESGAEILRMTAEQAAECSHLGDCKPEVTANLNAVEWIASDDTLRKMLKGYGAWDDMDEATTETLRMRALWIAACDIKENPLDYI